MSIGSKSALFAIDPESYAPGPHFKAIDIQLSSCEVLIKQNRCIPVFIVVNAAFGFFSSIGILKKESI